MGFSDGVLLISKKIGCGSCSQMAREWQQDLLNRLQQAEITCYVSDDPSQTEPQYRVFIDKVGWYPAFIWIPTGVTDPSQIKVFNGLYNSAPVTPHWNYIQGENAHPESILRWILNEINKQQPRTFTYGF